MLHLLSLRAKNLLPFIIHACRLCRGGWATTSWAMRQHDLEQGVENARLQAAVLSTSINKTLNDGLSTTQTLTSTFEILRRSHVVNRDMLNKISPASWRTTPACGQCGPAGSQTRWMATTANTPGKSPPMTTVAALCPTGTVIPRASALSRWWITTSLAPAITTCCLGKTGSFAGD